jgi:hypothetical protein
MHVLELKVDGIEVKAAGWVEILVCTAYIRSSKIIGKWKKVIKIDTNLQSATHLTAVLEVEDRVEETKINTHHMFAHVRWESTPKGENTWKKQRDENEDKREEGKEEENKKEI